MAPLLRILKCHRLSVLDQQQSVGRQQLTPQLGHSTNSGVGPDVILINRAVEYVAFVGE